MFKIPRNRELTQSQRQRRYVMKWSTQLNLKQITAADRRQLAQALTFMTYVAFNPRRKIMEEYLQFPSRIVSSFMCTDRQNVQRYKFGRWHLSELIQFKSLALELEI